MPRLFLGNFEFEHHLAAKVPRQLPEAVRRISAEMACVWVAIATDGEAIWTPDPVDPDFFDYLRTVGGPAVAAVTTKLGIDPSFELVPWGWTDEVRNFARAHRLMVDAPPQAVVRAVNSRRFSAQLERDWDVGLTGTTEVRSLKVLAEAIRAAQSVSTDWVVKAEFSMSARERILGRGTQVPQQARRWVEKRLRDDGVVFLEPWVERVAEVGLQFTIPKSGAPVFEGVTPLLTDRTGGYRGSRFSPDEQIEQIWKDAIAVGHRVAQCVQAEGYFGPLGIDAVRYRDIDGGTSLRPIQDVNGRYTMGRLSLGFRRLLNAGECGSWLHIGLPSDASGPAHYWREHIEPHRLPAMRLIRTAPFEVGGRPSRHIRFAVFAPNAEALAQFERAMLNRSRPSESSDGDASRLQNNP
jgi:hypothetical protein